MQYRHPSSIQDLGSVQNFDVCKREAPRPYSEQYEHFRVEGMSKVCATYHRKVVILMIVTYCVKKSSLAKINEKYITCSP